MRKVVVLTFVCICILAATLQAQPAKDIGGVLESKIKKARVEEALKSPVLSFTLHWEWDGRYTKKYSFRNRLRLGKPIEFSLQKGKVEKKTTSCLGVALASGKAVTHKSCFAAPNTSKKQNFVLTGVTLSFQNGRKLSMPAQAVRHSGEFSFLSLPVSFTSGVRLAQLHILPSGQTLQDVYGENFGGVKFSHALQKMDKSSRLSRGLRNRPEKLFSQVRPGEPLFWRGKLVALSAACAEDFWSKIQNGGDNFVWTAFHFSNGAGPLVK